MEPTIPLPLIITLTTKRRSLPDGTVCEKVALVRALDDEFVVTVPERAGRELGAGGAVLEIVKVELDKSSLEFAATSRATALIRH